MSNRGPFAAPVLDWINAPALQVADVPALRSDEREYLRRVVVYLRLLARSRHELDVRSDSVVVEKIQAGAGYAVVEYDPALTERARYEFPVRQGQRPMAKRPTLRKSVAADAAAVRRMIRRGNQDRLIALPKAAAAACHPGTAPTARTSAFLGRAIDEWERLSRRPVPLRRCASPRCASFGGAYFFPRTDDVNCESCRTLVNRSARDRDRGGKTGSLQVAMSGRKILQNDSRCKRP